MTRARSGSPYDLLETYHDRVRETVLGNMAPEVLRATHANIARAMLQLEIADPERLVVHYDRAGDSERAADAAIRAAHMAAQKLAFNRATQLFERSIDLLPPEDERRSELHRHLGAALANEVVARWRQRPI